MEVAPLPLRQASHRQPPQPDALERGEAQARLLTHPGHHVRRYALHGKAQALLVLQARLHGWQGPALEYQAVAQARPGRPGAIWPETSATSSCSICSASSVSLRTMRRSWLYTARPEACEGRARGRRAARNGASGCGCRTCLRWPGSRAPAGVGLLRMQFRGACAAARSPAPGPPCRRAGPTRPSGRSRESAALRSPSHRPAPSRLRCIARPHGASTAPSPPRAWPAGSVRSLGDLRVHCAKPSASMRCTCASSERWATGHMRVGTSS